MMVMKLAPSGLQMTINKPIKTRVVNGLAINGNMRYVNSVDFYKTVHQRCKRNGMINMRMPQR